MPPAASSSSAITSILPTPRPSGPISARCGHVPGRLPPAPPSLHPCLDKQYQHVMMPRAITSITVFFSLLLPSASHDRARPLRSSCPRSATQPAQHPPRNTLQLHLAATSRLNNQRRRLSHSTRLRGPRESNPHRAR